MRFSLVTLLCLVSSSLLDSIHADSPQQGKQRPQPPKSPEVSQGMESQVTDSPRPPKQANRAIPARPNRNNRGGESMRAALVPANSFSPPFEDYDDATGDRKISNSWKMGGSTDVHENFVRLTNDRQSKAGWVHNAEPISMMDFSIYVNFRISGAGQRLFGDGIAVWVTDMTETDWHRGGDFFAGPKDFKGFVVVLDTFKNSEMGTKHKDIMLFTNDGEQDVDLLHPLDGNNANYRYFEGRDDFSVLDFSVLHLMYRASSKKLTVMLDEKNTGEFRTMFQASLEHLPRGWDSELRVSFSATTGQLADNHDLLSVKLIKAGGRLPRSIEEEDVNPREIQSLERQVQKQSGGAQIAKLMKLYRRDSEKRLNHLHHAIEHELSFIQDSLESAIKKIKIAEKDDQERIQMLEKKAEEVAQQLLDRRLADAVESHLDGELDRKIEEKNEKYVSEVHKRISNVQEQHRNTVQDLHESVAKVVAENGGSGNSSWVALIIVVVGFTGVAVYLMRRVTQMEDKNHLP